MKCGELPEKLFCDNGTKKKHANFSTCFALRATTNDGEFWRLSSNSAIHTCSATEEICCGLVKSLVTQSLPWLSTRRNVWKRASKRDGEEPNRQIKRPIKLLDQESAVSVEWTALRVYRDSR